ncbi:MAG: SRPBCC family protein [Acidimicrobiia bacterium]|nr:SRPBCC family protein [Acidimicrobiia bacterium]
MEGTVKSAESSASAERLFEVASDLEAYPEWATAVKEVEVLATDESGRVTQARFVVAALIREISYVLNYTYEPPRSITWRAEPGDDIKAMEGSYRFEDVDGGTEVMYALAVEPAFKVPGFLRGQAERQIVSTALRELRKRAEEGA